MLVWENVFLNLLSASNHVILTHIALLQTDTEGLSDVMSFFWLLASAVSVFLLLANIMVEKNETKVTA